MKEKINFKNTIGVQIEDNNLKVAKIGYHKTAIKVEGYGKRKLVKGLMSEGVVKDPKTVSLFMERAIKNSYLGRIKGVKIVSSIPEKHCSVNLVMISDVEKDQFEKNVKTEIDRLTNGKTRNYYFDYHKLEKNRDKVLTVLVYVKKEIIDTRIQTFNKAGYIVFGLEPESFALARCFMKNIEDDYEITKEKQKIEIIFNIGNGYSFVLAKKGQAVVYSKVFDFSKKAIVEKIMNKLKEKEIKETEAKQMILNFGFDFSTKEGEQIFKSSKKEFKVFKHEYDEIVDFLRVNFRAKKTEIPVYVTGPGSLIKGMDTVISRNIESEVSEDKEFSNYDFLHKDLTIPKKIIRDFSVVLGLGFESIVKEKKNVN